MNSRLCQFRVLVMTAMSMLLAASQTVFAFTPNDFAFGLELEVDSTKGPVAQFQLPAEVFEHFFFPVPEVMPSSFIIRRRHVRRWLKKLRLDQAAGPDGINAFFLRSLAEVVDLPIAILCRRIFQEATWPSRWRVHHIAPLFKKGNTMETLSSSGKPHFNRGWFNKKKCAAT